MLADFNSWLRGWAEYMFDTTDEDYAKSVYIAYSYVCEKSGNSWIGCNRNIDEVGKVLLAYITFFTTHPDPSHAKYYYDEFSDRHDSYREELVSTLAKSTNLEPAFVNDVLSCLYWEIKRGKLPEYILKPIGVAKFAEQNWYLKGIWKGIFSITTAIYDLIINTFVGAGYLIEQSSKAVGGALSGVSKVLGVTGNALSYLPYVLAGGLALVAGFEVYKYKKTGKITTPKEAINGIL